MLLTITSLNLQGFEHWDSRAPHIFEYMQKTKPDVICFQEVVYLPSISSQNPVHLLNEDLHYPYELSEVTRLQKGIEHEVYREGLAVLSHHQVIKSETIILKQAEGDEHNRIVQLLDIQIDSGLIVKIANIHLSVTNTIDYATAQLEEILELLKLRNEKRILIGDFNLSFLENSTELWSKDYKSTCDMSYITFPTENKRIDYALVPNEYLIDSVNVSGDGLSDHRALTVTITIPNPI
ncbi:MAG: endonuclease/exonuclease/phosphatase family protein [Candidatus Saccharimonadaceae bacterium]